MNSIYEVSEYLESRGVRFQMDSDNEALMFMVGGEAGAYPFILKVGSENDGLTQVWGRASFQAPTGARAMVAEGVCRANHRMRVGKFEFDLADGELLFHAAHIIDGNMSGDVIDRMIATTIAMLDRYCPAFLSMIYANAEPATAISQAEGKSAA